MKSDNNKEGARKRNWTQLKTALGHVGLLVALMAYTAVGGLVFSMLERPGEEERLTQLHEAAAAQRRALLALVANLTAAAAAAMATATTSDPAGAPAAASALVSAPVSAPALHLEHALAAYEASLESAVRGGVALPYVVNQRRPPTRWNLTQAVFFASTVLTTIGYGHIAPLTFWGRAFCMLYALVGIPLTLTAIAAMGRLLASAVSALHARARRHTASLPVPPVALPQRCRTSLTMLAAVACMLLYMAAGAGLIRLWEDWSFFEGFYFCFITMTTIGFGDIVPVEADYMMPCTLYILAGLALTSTIIELVRRQYAQSWRHLQALSGPLADSLRRLGESAALAGSGIDVTALHRMLTIVSVPKRHQEGGGGGGAKARDEWEQAMAAVLREITAPPPRPPVLQIVIYETTV